LNDIFQLAKSSEGNSLAYNYYHCFYCEGNSWFYSNHCFSQSHCCSWLF